MAEALWIVLGNPHGTKKILLLRIIKNPTARGAIDEVIEMHKINKYGNPREWNYVALNCYRDPEQIRANLEEFFKRIGVPETIQDQLVQGVCNKILQALNRRK